MRPASQRELDFAAADEARALRAAAEARLDDLDALMAPAVDRLGHKFFAEALGLGLEKVDRVYHWMERRNNQRPPAELLLAVVSEDDAAMARLCDLAGYEAPKRKANIPDAELARRAIAALKEFGAAGEQKVRALLSSPMQRETPAWEATTPSGAAR